MNNNQKSIPVFVVCAIKGSSVIVKPTRHGATPANRMSQRLFTGAGEEFKVFPLQAFHLLLGKAEMRCFAGKIRLAAALTPRVRATFLAANA